MMDDGKPSRGVFDSKIYSLVLMKRDSGLDEDGSVCRDTLLSHSSLDLHPHGKSYGR